LFRLDKTLKVMPKKDGWDLVVVKGEIKQGKGGVFFGCSLTDTWTEKKQGEGKETQTVNLQKRINYKELKEGATYKAAYRRRFIARRNHLCSSKSVRPPLSEMPSPNH